MSGPMCPAAYGAPQIETERFLVGEARAFPASLNTKGIIFHGKEENRTESRPSRRRPQCHGPAGHSSGAAHHLYPGRELYALRH
ncbi:MAG TPA: hypothetical protein DIT21_00435, partial [Oscillibacter sp.]|nr:hypothetical protein [Oscillibacter sp.]